MFTIQSLASLLAALPIAWSHPMWGTELSFMPGFPYGSQTVRGVNLGGWLVIEVCRYPSSVSPRVICLPSAMDKAEFVRWHGQSRDC